MTLRIDAHHHLWRASRGDYHWFSSEISQIVRDFLPQDMEPLLRRYGIGKTVLIQATETDAETDFLLELGAEADFVAAVVGWADLTRTDVGARLAEIAESPLLRGIRPMAQWAEPGWLLREDVAAGIAEVQRIGLRFDALVFAHQLPDLVRFAGRFPDLPLVIDHLAKPQFEPGEDFKGWHGHMRSLAQDTPACCKLSGLVTEVGCDWQVDQLRPYVDAVISLFGPDRVMWGSDWPVSELAHGWDAWVAATEILLRELTSAERDRVLGGTAAAFYGL